MSQANCIECEKPIRVGESLMSLIQLERGGKMANALIHFDCFADAFGKRIAQHTAAAVATVLEDMDAGVDLDSIAASIVAKLARNR